MLIITQTALELGFLYALVAMALFLSYRILDIADLTTDGCFVLGAAVSVTVTAAGHPVLAIFAAMLAGACAGFVTAFLQTKLGVPSIVLALIGSHFGTKLQLMISEVYLQYLLLIVLPVVAFVVLRQRQLPEERGDIEPKKQMAIVYLAALTSIDPSLYEAATVDGASWWQKLTNITIPLVRPSLTVSTVLNIIYVFNSFPII